MTDPTSNSRTRSIENFSKDNQPVQQKPSTVSTQYQSKQHYFNNGGRGFTQPERIKTASGIQVELYSNQLIASKRQKIAADIHATVNKFTTTFQLASNTLGDGEKLKIYLFNDQADYSRLGGAEKFKLGLGNEGGKFYYRRDPNDRASEIYIYQQRDALNLAHELVHALTYYAIGSETNKMPTVLLEGIAEYFEHDAAANGLDLNSDDCLALTADKIVALTYSEDPQQNKMVYTVGHALAAYLQQQNTSFIKDYFTALRTGAPGTAEALLADALQDIGAFKRFVSYNSSESLIKES